MPELPEVETTLRGIRPWLQDQRIERVIVRQPRLRWPVASDVQRLEGQPVLSLSRRAKYIEVETPVGRVLWHLGMSGSLRLVEAQAPIGKHDHIDWILSNGKVLRYHDPRRFGALIWLERDEDSVHLAHLGPEPLAAEFNAEYLFARSRKKTQAIKTFIMDGRVVVGVGNIYANESLFKAGIHPASAAGTISLKSYEILVQHIKETLAQAIEQGGTTLRDFVGGDGKPGYFAQQLLVYGRAGKSCLHCQTILQEIRQGQRSSVFCPTCQR